MLMDLEQKQMVHTVLFWDFLKQKLANKPFTIVGDGKQKSLCLCY